MALFFGFQSLQAYVIFGWFASMWRDAGFSAAEAGLLVGLVAATAIPLSLWAPTRLANSADPRWLLFAILACYLVGYAGILVAPRTGAVAWALLVGAATTTFPLVLTLVGLRARTTEGTAALSSVTQSVGYLIAAAGPFSFGALHDATGGWTWPLLAADGAGAPTVRARGVRRPAGHGGGPAQANAARRELSVTLAVSGAGSAAPPRRPRRCRSC